uniref:hypothetical protein n=1 Tax=Lactococcus garvieae TaxID=1363 RepID=UPI00359C24AA
MIEEKFEQIYDFDFCKRLLERGSNDWRKMRFQISQEIFDVRQNYTLSYLLKMNFETYLKRLNRPYVTVELDEKNIIFLNRTELMKTTITVKIPYEDYGTSYEFIDEVNQLVGSDGILTVFANNAPYRWDYGLVIETIETLEKFREIIALVRQYPYQLEYGFGRVELVEEMRQQQYSIGPIHQFMSLKEIKSQVLTVHFFRANAEGRQSFGRLERVLKHERTKE